MVNDLYCYNVICINTKDCSLMDVGFEAKLHTFKSKLYHLLDRKSWANYLSILSQYLRIIEMRIELVLYRVVVN